jgi:hypothetical protein
MAYSGNCRLLHPMGSWWDRLSRGGLRPPLLSPGSRYLRCQMGRISDTLWCWHRRGSHRRKRSLSLATKIPKCSNRLLVHALSSTVANRCVDLDLHRGSKLDPGPAYPYRHGHRDLLPVPRRRHVPHRCPVLFSNSLRKQILQNVPGVASTPNSSSPLVPGRSAS